MSALESLQKQLLKFRATNYIYMKYSKYINYRKYQIENSEIFQNEDYEIYKI